MRFEWSSFRWWILGMSGQGIAQSPWLDPYGDAGCASHFVPTLHTGGEMSTLGNANFKLTSENLRGGAPGVFFSFQCRGRPALPRDEALHRS